MNKRIRQILIPVFLWTLSLSLGAQKLPSVAAFSLSSRDISDPVAKTSNDVVFSFIRELRTYRIVDLRTEPLPVNLGVPDGMDYIFYGDLENVTDGIRLELVLKGGPYAVTRKISRVYDSMNRILLESRMLVRDLFDQLCLQGMARRMDQSAAVLKGRLVVCGFGQTEKITDGRIQIGSQVGSFISLYHAEVG